MTRLEAALDALNIFAKDVERATRRKRKINREQLIAAAKIGTVLIGVVAAFVPQLKIVAGILNGLNASTPTILPANAGDDGQQSEELMSNITP